MYFCCLHLSKISVCSWVASVVHCCNKWIVREATPIYCKTFLESASSRNGVTKMVSEGAWVQTNRSSASNVAGTISICVSYSNMDDFPVKIFTTAAPQMICCFEEGDANLVNATLGVYRSNHRHNTLFVILVVLSASDGKNVPGE